MLLLPVAAASTRRIEEDVMFKTLSEEARRTTTSSELDGDSVSAGWLASKLRGRTTSKQGAPYVLDFRCPQEFRRAHIEGSVNVVIPTLLYRRLQRGSVSASSVIISMDEVRRHRRTPLILVDDEPPSGCAATPSPSVGIRNGLLISNLVYRRLSEEGYPVAYLQGTLNQFLSEYPEFGVCTGSADPVCSGAEGAAGSVQATSNWNAFPTSSFSASYQSSTTSCMVKMKALRLEDTPETDAPSSSRRAADSGLDHRRAKGATCRLSKNALSTPAVGLVMPGSSCALSTFHSGRTAASLDYKVDNSGHFPVEIIPFLYLGNASNAADMDILVKYNIKYIVNVTRNLPNAFEHDNRLKYLQIPIDDNWSQNLAAHFPQAIHFIDEARSKKCGVLVHCLAGISRSVTVTVAYLMHTLALSLDDAYDLVKRHKPNISPNFDFLGQLVEFERHTVAARSGSVNQQEQSNSTAVKETVTTTTTTSTATVEDRQIGTFHHSVLTVGTSS
uniref:protein-tyrosine-phosphatase n=1 Tax=Trichuris muris TaxID=70415 RepID=A0A5S6QX70_TRIMR